MPRLSPLLVFLLALLAGCASGPDEVPSRDAVADSLLTHVTGDAWDEAFARTASGEWIRTTESEGGETETARTDSMPNPLPAFLSDEPPYLDAAASDQYTTRALADTTIAGRRARLVDARFVADGRRTQPIRYVRAAVDPASGALLAIEVHREFESALYDETSRLVAALTSGDGALVPDHASIQTRTDVPMSPSRSGRVRWVREP